MSEFKKGDRVDYRDLRNGEVVRVGRATLWASFQTIHGNRPVAEPLSEFRHHVPQTEFRVGEFLLRRPGSRDSKVQIHWGRTGEMMETEQAVLESYLMKFWARMF